MTKPHKNWTELQAQSSWRMFKIMAEFVEGFENLEKVGPCISIFGSARVKEDNPYYELARKVANRLSEEGYGIITGGGPGVMEAANRGAHDAGGDSVGLNIDLPHEQESNPYIDPDKLFNYNYFFVRKVMLVRYAQAFVLMPGGFGTMDELFESLTLIQTKKIAKVPVILVGEGYWSGLMSWLKETLLEQNHFISPEDLDLFSCTDDPEEIVDIINNHYLRSSLMPNF